MKNNNSYLKHQMKILAQSEGITVEAREKAYQYVEKYIEKLLQEDALLREDMDHLAAELKEAHDTIRAKKEIQKLRDSAECKSVITQTTKGIKAEVKTAKKKAPAKKAAEKK